MRRCWWHACRDENINPRAPTRLPLLFALDAKLDIPNGFRYAPDREAARSQDVEDDKSITVYSGSDFLSDSFDGGTEGFGGDGGGDGGGGGCGGD